MVIWKIISMLLIPVFVSFHCNLCVCLDIDILNCCYFVVFKYKVCNQFRMPFIQIFNFSLISFGVRVCLCV